MLRFLVAPYPFESSLARRLSVCLVVSVFVFLFLYIFQPFGLSTYPVSVLMLTLGYGLVSLLVMVSLNLMMLYSFPRYFNDNKWTTGKELLWLLIMIALIGLANAIYTNLMHIGTFSLRSILFFEFYALAVGVFPVTISVLVNQRRLQSSYQKSSDEINASLEATETEAKETISERSIPIVQQSQTEYTPFESAQPESKEEPKTELEKPLPIIIVAENGKDKFTVLSEEILFIRSADNYVEVFYHRNNQTRCELIRTTLKHCVDLLSNQFDFFKCHKSYLVNLTMVNHVSGNAQGYKLHLKNTDELVPVSRTHNDFIKRRLSNHP